MSVLRQKADILTCGGVLPPAGVSFRHDSNGIPTTFHTSHQQRPLRCRTVAAIPWRESKLLRAKLGQSLIDEAILCKETHERDGQSGVRAGGCYGPVRRKPTYQEKSFVVSAFCKPRPTENTKWSCSLKS